MRKPANRKKKLPCIALQIKRGGKEILLPDDQTLLYPHDRILFAGNISARKKLDHIVSFAEVLHYTATGVQLPTSYFGRWVTRLFRKKDQNEEPG